MEMHILQPTPHSDVPVEGGLALANKGGTFSPVTVTNNDTVGAIFLGVLALLLLIALLGARRKLT